MKIHTTEREGVYLFFCPGCNCGHWFSTSGFSPAQAIDDKIPKGPRWTWNGDTNKPTIRASILTTHGVYPNDDPSTWKFDENKVVIGYKKVVCHSFITEGKIQFLDDCTHDLKGQTVDLPDF